MAPGQLVREEQPDRVRVTWRGDEYELEAPTIEADSLIGQDSGTRIAIPISEIETLETRKVNLVAVVVGVGLLALTVVAFVPLVACVTGDGCS